LGHPEGRPCSIGHRGPALRFGDLRKEHSAVSLPVFVKLARSRKILDGTDKGPSKDSHYRLFKRHGLEKDTRLPEDRRRFETDLPNDMWQSDCMHGPQVAFEGRLRIAVIPKGGLSGAPDETWDTDWHAALSLPMQSY